MGALCTILPRMTPVVRCPSGFSTGCPLLSHLRFGDLIVFIKLLSHLRFGGLIVFIKLLLVGGVL